MSNYAADDHSEIARRLKEIQRESSESEDSESPRLSEGVGESPEKCEGTVSPEALAKFYAWLGVDGESKAPEDVSKSTEHNYNTLIWNCIP